MNPIFLLVEVDRSVLRLVANGCNIFWFRPVTCHSIHAVLMWAQKVDPAAAFRSISEGFQKPAGCGEESESRGEGAGLSGFDCSVGFWRIAPTRSGRGESHTGRILFPIRHRSARTIDS